MSAPWVVLKFGGTSVGSRRALRRAAGVVLAASGSRRVAVVVSALAGVTNALETSASRAARGEPVAGATVRMLRQRHQRLLHAVAPREEARALAALEPWLAHLGGRLELAARTRTLEPAARAELLATGERLAVHVFAAVLRARGRDATPVDASELFAVHGEPLAATPDLVATRERVAAWAAAAPELPVITGFLAAGADGATWLLGRGGSDLSATLLAHALGAERVEIWTDTPGVLTADPRLEPLATPHRALRPATASRLARLGARVLHPRSLEPLLESSPGTRAPELFVRDTFHPERAGTRVARGAQERLATIVGGPALVRVATDSGLATARLAAVLRAHEIPALLSPLDDSLMVPASAVANVRATALAGLRFTPGPHEARLVSVAAMHRGPSPDRVARSLAEAGVFPLAPPARLLAGVTGAVVAEADVPAATRALHAAFVRARVLRVDVVLAGARGRVGRGLLARLAGASRSRRVGLRLVAAFDTRGFVSDPLGLDPAAVPRLLESSAPQSLARTLSRLGSSGGAPLVFVDCTASEAVAARHASLLARGIGVVTANKHALAAAGPRWRALREAARRAPLRAATTVGAGLPVLSTVRGLSRRGDALVSLRATLSGTLAYVLSAAHAGTPLSRAVADAHALGLTEPNPAVDLSGADVARKLVIVLRAAGIEVEPDDVRVEPLVGAAALAAADAAALVAALENDDAAFAARVARARAAGKRLVHAATYDANGPRAGLIEVDERDALALARPGENVVRLRTAIHDRVPLVIAGPGAGVAVTAAGVHGDLLSAAKALLAREAARPSRDGGPWPQRREEARVHPAWA